MHLTNWANAACSCGSVAILRFSVIRIAMGFGKSPAVSLFEVGSFLSELNRIAFRLYTY